jgi:pSer/pThr/pTyr-binding forkhead associated (FHA) protein
MSSPFDGSASLPEGAVPKLVVTRGQQRGADFALKPGQTILGRAAAGDQPVDIELDNQEQPGRAFAANHHAIITWENNALAVEDTGTAHGTYVNRVRIPPNTKQTLNPEDTVQVGTVQFQVKV